MIHTVKGFGIVSEAEVDSFMEFSCFFCDPTVVENLISASSAFSKFSLNIWELLVHILLKPSLENFEHYFASIWNECNHVVVWTFFWIAESFLKPFLCSAVCKRVSFYVSICSGVWLTMTIRIESCSGFSPLTASVCLPPPLWQCLP